MQLSEREGLMNIPYAPATTDLLLFYPGESLTDQISRWNEKCPRRRIVASFERSLPEIRKLMHRGGAALVDATEDPLLAADALLQAIGRLGKDAVAMYSEVGHEESELFTRMQGSLFILGPLRERHWAEFFERFLENEFVVSAARRPDETRLPLPLWLDRAARLRQWFTHRYGDNSDRPITGIN